MQSFNVVFEFTPCGWKMPLRHADVKGESYDYSISFTFQHSEICYKNQIATKNRKQTKQKHFRKYLQIRIRVFQFLAATIQSFKRYYSCIASKYGLHTNIIFRLMKIDLQNTDRSQTMQYMNVFSVSSIL